MQDESAPQATPPMSDDRVPEGPALSQVVEDDDVEDADASLAAVEEQALVEAVAMPANDGAIKANAADDADAVAADAAAADAAAADGAAVEDAAVDDAAADDAAANAGEEGEQLSWEDEGVNPNKTQRERFIQNLVHRGAPQDVVCELEDDNDSWAASRDEVADSWTRLWRVHAVLAGGPSAFVCDRTRDEVTALLSDISKNTVDYVTAARAAKIAALFMPQPCKVTLNLVRHAMRAAYDGPKYQARVDIVPDIRAAMTMARTYRRYIDAYVVRREEDASYVCSYVPAPQRTPAKNDFIALSVAVHSLTSPTFHGIVPFATAWELENDLHVRGSVDPDVAYDCMTRIHQAIKWANLGADAAENDETLVDLGNPEPYTAWRLWRYAETCLDPALKDNILRVLCVSRALNIFLEVCIAMRTSPARRQKIAMDMQALWEQTTDFIKQSQRLRAKGESTFAQSPVSNGRAALTREVNDRSSPSDIPDAAHVTKAQFRKLLEEAPNVASPRAPTTHVSASTGLSSSPVRHNAPANDRRADAPADDGHDDAPADDALDDVLAKELRRTEGSHAPEGGVAEGSDAGEDDLDALLERERLRMDAPPEDAQVASVDDAILALLEDGTATEPGLDVDVEDVAALRDEDEAARYERTTYVNAQGVRYERIAAEEERPPLTLDGRFDEIKALMKEDWTGVDRLHPRVISFLSKVNEFVAVLAELLGSILSIGPVVGNSIAHRLGVTKPDIPAKPYNIFARFLSNASKRCVIRRKWDDLFGAKQLYKAGEIGTHWTTFKAQFDTADACRDFLTAYDLEHAAGSEPTVDGWRKAFDQGVRTVEQLFTYFETSREMQAICLIASGRPDVRYEGRDTAIVSTSGVRHFFDGKTHLTQDEMQVLFSTEAKYGAGSEFVRLRLGALGLEPADQPVHTAKEVVGTHAQRRTAGLPGKDAADAAITFDRRYGGLPLDVELPPAPEGFVNAPTWTGTPFRSALINVQIPVKKWPKLATTGKPRTIPNKFHSPYAIESLVPLFEEHGFTFKTNAVDRFPSKEVYNFMVENQLGVANLDWYAGFWFVEARRGTPDGLNALAKLAMASLLGRAGEPTVQDSFRIRNAHKVFERFPQMAVGEDDVVWPLFISTLIAPNTPNIPAVFWNTARVVLNTQTVLGLPLDQLAEWFKVTKWATVDVALYRRESDPHAPHDAELEGPLKPGATKGKAAKTAKSKAIVESDVSDGPDDDTVVVKQAKPPAKPPAKKAVAPHGTRGKDIPPAKAKAKPAATKTAAPHGADDNDAPAAKVQAKTAAKKAATAPDADAAAVAKAKGKTVVKKAAAASDSDDDDDLPIVKAKARPAPKKADAPIDLSSDDDALPAAKAKAKATTATRTGEKTSTKRGRGATSGESEGEARGRKTQRTRTSTGAVKASAFKAVRDDDADDEDFAPDDDNEGPSARTRSRSRSRSRTRATKRGLAASDVDSDAAFEVGFNRKKQKMTQVTLAARPSVAATPAAVRPSTVVGRARDWLQRYKPTIAWLRDAIEFADAYDLDPKTRKAYKKEYDDLCVTAERHRGDIARLELKGADMVRKQAAAKKASRASTSAPPDAPDVVEVGHKYGYVVEIPREFYDQKIAQCIEMCIHYRQTRALVPAAIAKAVLAFADRLPDDAEGPNLLVITAYVRKHTERKA
ncbi:hypothetical protein EXIGLDRAFT_708720 [Exidia glandulosa HHB12029]|uniref:Uncharacterized protein n=1 Tax=Exidia glandulosa HHB12029 TaxID=1314781 RepID=A0A165Z252_EXIGL|nr:hypothetical protein EXIGLDRAFT_708720 [Exidia glandulosa HHB12029]